jgi:imidazole glycerol-phosphate synthase subunit HisH
MNADVDIINYGMGNLRSVENAVLKLNFKPKIVLNPDELNSSRRIILPGVGSFKSAMSLLIEGGWISNLKKNVLENKKPLFGICLGMQLLGTDSEEHGHSEGLNFIPGKIKSLKNLGCKDKLPQIGWNTVNFKKDHKYIKDIPNLSDFYFVNSFVFSPLNQDDLISSTNYGIDFCSIISNKNIFGTQFHPEKSSKIGLKILENFLNA